MYLTKEYFDKRSPEVGDLFSEFHSVFKMIVKITDKGEIYLLCGHPRSSLRLDKRESFDDLDKSLRYGSIDGYWMDFVGNQMGLYRDFVDTYLKETGDIELDRDKKIEFSLL